MIVRLSYDLEEASEKYLGWFDKVAPDVRVLSSGRGVIWFLTSSLDMIRSSLKCYWTSPLR